MAATFIREIKGHLFLLHRESVSECYQSLTAHQHQKGHTVPTGDNDCNVNSSHYSLSTALCESIRYQAQSEQNVRQDLIPRVGHGEAALSTPGWMDGWTLFPKVSLEINETA